MEVTYFMLYKYYEKNSVNCRTQDKNDITG